MPPKKKAKKAKIGFDCMAERLDTIFHSLLPTKPATATTNGHINTAHRRLQSSFSSSMKGRIAPTTATPRSVSPMPSTGRSISTRSSAPPSAERNARSPSLLPPPLEEGDDRGTVGRHDGVALIRSSTNHGMKRLKNAQILRLMQHDELTLVIPPTDYKQPKSSIQPRKNLMHEFCRVILSASARKMNTEEKEEYMLNELSLRSILRDRKEHHEYNVRICNYPERPKLARYDPLTIDLEYMLRGPTRYQSLHLDQEIMRL